MTPAVAEGTIAAVVQQDVLMSDSGYSGHIGGNAPDMGMEPQEKEL